jgi:hypothetical protein
LFACIAGLKPRPKKATTQSKIQSNELIKDSKQRVNQRLKATTIQIA